MRGRSYSRSPPPRGYGRRGRSPSPRGRYGGRGHGHGHGHGRPSANARDLPTSLLVRNRHDMFRRRSQMDDLKSVKSNLRCHHCAGPLTKEMETNEWTVAPFIRDSFSMIGSAVGGTTSAFYGFNHVMPVVRKWIKGPMWLQFLVGAPPVMVLSSACAGLGGGAVPALAQLSSSSYHAVVSSSKGDKLHKSKTSTV